MVNSTCKGSQQNKANSRRCRTGRGLPPPTPSPRQPPAFPRPLCETNPICTRGKGSVGQAPPCPWPPLRQTNPIRPGQAAIGGEICETNPISLAGGRSRAPDARPTKRGLCARQSQFLPGEDAVGIPPSTLAPPASGPFLVDYAKRIQFGGVWPAKHPAFHYSIIPPSSPMRIVRNKANFPAAPGDGAGGTRTPGPILRNKANLPPGGRGKTTAKARGLDDATRDGGKCAKRTQFGGVRRGPGAGYAKQSQFGAARLASGGRLCKKNEPNLACRFGATEGEMCKTNPISESWPAARYPSFHYSIIPPFQPDAAVQDQWQAPRTAFAAATRRCHPWSGPLHRWRAGMLADCRAAGRRL
jgi:hypothetical protein